MTDKTDLAVIPEAFWLDGTKDIMDYRDGVSRRYSDYLRAAQLQLHSFADIKEELVKSLKSKDPIIRYWAVTACCHFGKEAESLEKQLLSMLGRKETSIISSKAALYCIKNEEDIPYDIFKDILAKSENEAAVLMILNDIAVLYDTDKDYVLELTEDHLPFRPTAYNDRLEYFRTMNELRRD